MQAKTRSIPDSTILRIMPRCRNRRVTEQIRMKASWTAEMKQRYAYLEIALFAIAAVFLLAIAATSSHIRILNAICRHDVGAERGAMFRTLMALYGAGFALACVGSLGFVRSDQNTLCAHCLRWIFGLWRETSATCHRLFETEHLRNHALWLALIVAVGAAVRCYFLAQPMRYDESFTFLGFVNRGFSSLFFYPLPNNHVLHTLLVRLSVGVFGAHPVTIRLPAFVAGVLSIPLTFALAKSLNAKPAAGFVAASMVAVFPYLILYDTMARGYSLLVFLSLCLVAIGLRIIENPSPELSAVMAFPIALGLFDMPSFLFPVAGVLLWLAFALPGRGHRAIRVLTHVVAPCVIVTAIITFILYTPVIIASNGIHSIVANRFVQAESFHQFLVNIPTHISHTACSFSRSVPTPVLVALAVLFFGGLYTTARERNRVTLALLPAFLIGAVALLFAKRAIPFDRTWIYFLPLAFVFVDAGLAGVRCLSVSHIKMGLLVISAGTAIMLMKNNTISAYPDTGHFPEAPIVVDILSQEITPQDGLIVVCPADFPVYFYMWYKNVPSRKGAPDSTPAARDFVVVQPSRQSVGDLTGRKVRRLTGFGDAELYVTVSENDTEVL